MLAKGNAKLGNVYNWSLPAGKENACPGESSGCRSVCYAKDGFFLMPSVKQAYERNTRLRTEADWETNVIEELKHKKVKIMRIHVSGDFDTVTYIKRWHRIVRASPDVQFYAYTRSWNVPYLYPHLVELAAESNFHMWFSADNSMPEPPKPPRVRIAYLALSDQDGPKYKTDLVFRDDHKSPIKTMGTHKDLVCPYEQGIARKVPITCETCGICFTEGRYGTTASNKGKATQLIQIQPAVTKAK